MIECLLSGVLNKSIKTSGGFSDSIFLSVQAVFQQLEKMTTSVILLQPVSSFPKAANYSFVFSVSSVTVKTKFGRRDQLLITAILALQLCCCRHINVQRTHVNLVSAQAFTFW